MAVLYHSGPGGLPHQHKVPAFTIGRYKRDINGIEGGEKDQQNLLPEEPKNPYLAFGPKADMSKDVDFQREVEHLPFQLNLMDASVNKEQQKQIMLDIIYANQEVFSL